ncbi:MAG: hypothetical protein ACJ74C_03205 [Gaiellaceae bacterium]
MGRAAALLVLLAALALYYAFHDRLWSASTWWDIAFLGLVLIPACFALVWIVLPLWRARGLLAVAAALALLAWAFHDAGWNTAENFCKLFAVTAVGFAFLRWFELLSWVALVACIIPFVDAFSVFSPRGPTNEIIKHHEHVFTTFSFAFPIPGERAAANLGLPDLLFFSLFLAATARFGLRSRLTWLVMIASFGATLAIASVWRGGLPALPLLAIGFLAVNADLIWPRVRQERLSLRSPS